MADYRWYTLGDDPWYIVGRLLTLGTWLAVVPHVVTLGEEVSAPDAAVLTQHFWHNIGLGREPGPALEEALAYCPPAVGELVVRHW